jgi:hypothetical protein
MMVVEEEVELAQVQALEQQVSHKAQWEEERILLLPYTTCRLDMPDTALPRRSIVS